MTSELDSVSFLTFKVGKDGEHRVFFAPRKEGKMSATEFYGGQVKAELARNRGREVAGEDVKGNREKDRKDGLSERIQLMVGDFIFDVAKQMAASNGETDPGPGRLAVLRKEAAEKIRELL